MKNLVILLIISLFASNICIGKNNKDQYLILSKVNTTQKIYIKSEKYVKIWTTENQIEKVYKGKFSIIDSLHIKINETIIPILAIHKVYGSDSDNQKTGTGLMAAGSTAIVGSFVYFKLSDQGYDTLFALAVGVVGTFTTIFGIAVYNSFTTHSIGKKWSISIDSK